jgi:branched-chain amino acid aminotransferase
MIVNLDGRFCTAEQACLPLQDSALLFGDSLFETIKVQNNKVLRIEAHLDRLALSASLLDFPRNHDEVRTNLLQTAERCPWPLARLRLTLTRGICNGLAVPPAQHARTIITAVSCSEPDDIQRKAGATCVFAPNRRVNPLSHLPQMKRGNYADCLYAARYAQSRGAREALFRTDEGHILEGATSNLFLIRDKTLITPAAGELVLAGVMRRQVLQAADTLGFTVRQQPIDMQTLFQADEAFLTNAIIEIMPIARLENFPLKRGPLALELLQAIRDGAAS